MSMQDVAPEQNEEGKISTTGHIPGKGTYACTACGQVVILNNDTDELPPCPRCGGTDFTH